MLFFNKKIAKSLNWDPYAQVKNNQWTVSELRRVTKAATRDLDGKSGMTAADQWGMAQIDPGTAGMMALLTGSNLEMIKGSNGKFTYNMDNKDIINTINIGKALFKDDKVNYAGKADAVHFRPRAAPVRRLVQRGANHQHGRRFRPDPLPS